MNHVNKFIVNQSEDETKTVSPPNNNFEVSDDLSSNHFDEEEPIEYLNKSMKHKVYFDEAKHLKLTEKACKALIEGCDYGSEWVNSDFLWELAMIDPDLWTSYEYFELYEKALRHGWRDIVSEFRSKNPSLEQFCNFFEWGLLKACRITSENDQAKLH